VRAATNIAKTDRFRASAYEYLRPQGWADVIGVGLLRGSNAAGLLCVHRCAENAMAINTATITTPETAVKAQAEAQRKRSVAKALAKDGDSTGARFALAEAADLDRAAAASLHPKPRPAWNTRKRRGWRHGRRSAEARAAARERGEARTVLIAGRSVRGRQVVRQTLCPSTAACANLTIANHAEDSKIPTPARGRGNNLDRALAFAKNQRRSPALIRHKLGTAREAAIEMEPKLLIFLALPRGLEPLFSP
jgi:hypothetical protein